jgi:3-dehydroquinate synthase
MGMIGQADVERIRDLYVRAGLPVNAPNLGAENYLRLMGLDKKVEGGILRFVLLKRIGDAVVRADVPSRMLMETLTECTADVQSQCLS